jgi:DNA polymerase III sliding clamp (beta) subunit (PCNA family)
MVDTLESRLTRKSYEKVILILDQNTVTCVLSDGLKTRQEEFNLPNSDEAEVYYNQSIIDALLRGFKKDG